MKKIKLFYGILIGLMIFLSCSSDDNSNSNSIIGTWKPVKYVDVCSTGNTEIEDYDSCRQNGRIIFFENKTFSSTEFSSIKGNCVEDYSFTGTWSLNGTDLTLTTEGDTEIMTVFELNNDVLQSGFIETTLDYECDGGHLTSEYTEFVRVK